MTRGTPAVSRHLARAALGGLVQPLSVAFEAVFESEFLVHSDHLGVFAVADVTARGLADCRSRQHRYQQCENQCRFHEYIITGLYKLYYDPDHTRITVCHNYLNTDQTEEAIFFSARLTIFPEVIK